MSKIEVNAQIDKLGKSTSAFVAGLSEAISKSQDKETLVSMRPEVEIQKKIIQVKAVKKDKNTTVVSFEYGK